MIERESKGVIRSVNGNRRRGKGRYKGRTGKRSVQQIESGEV